MRRYRETKKASSAVRRPADKSYFICSTPRTGSFLLAEALESTRIAGQPKEYFDQMFEKYWCDRLGITAASDYFPRIMAGGTSANGIFGAKLHWHQFGHLMTKVRQREASDAPDSDLLRRMFPDLRYVFLTRRNKVRQAVSYVSAIRTGVWFVLRSGTSEQQLAPAPPPFEFEAIDHWVGQLTKFDNNWRRYFESVGVQPFELVYEDFVEAYEWSVLAILRALGLPVSEEVNVAAPRLVKQANQVSEEWLRRYHERKAREQMGQAALRTLNEPSYQIRTRRSGASHILSPSLTPKVE